MENEQNLSQIRSLSHIINLEGPISNNSELVNLCELNGLDKNCEAEYITKINMICKRITYPITLVLEDKYVDRVYTNMYYNYFSKKHFCVGRMCKRLTFFKGTMDEVTLLNAKEEELQSKVVGTMVLRPLENGKIGRTLLDPRKMNLSPLYIRTTEFKVEVLGKYLKINAFPFSEQDSEVMTCAQTTLWGILEYYGNKYAQYKCIQPFDITRYVDSVLDERGFPAKGLDYYTASKVLKNFGFEPKVYSIDSYRSSDTDTFSNKYKNIFNYYVESGIPIGVGTTLPVQNNGHSTICIGHGSVKYDDINSNIKMIGDLPFIDACDFQRKYVIIDDNRIPYTIEDFKNFTVYDDAFVDIFVVPLHKRICIEADMAAEFMKKTLTGFCDSIKQYIKLFALEYNNYNNPLVTRLFLTSSRKFKRNRVESSTAIDEKRFYANMLYPKFLWVVEISTLDLYKNKEVVGEIIFDATTAARRWRSNLISIRIGSFVGYRLLEDTFYDLKKRLLIRNKGFCDKYQMYMNN